MQTKTILITVWCLFAFYSTYGQHVQLPEDISTSLVKREKAEMMHDYNRLMAYNVDSLTESSKWDYYFKKSILHLYLDKDSTVHFLNLAFQKKPYSTCKILEKAASYFNHQITSGYKPADFTWFLWDLPSAASDSILQKCKEVPSQTTLTDTIQKSALGALIRERDQKYRVMSNMKKQDSLDLINRHLIDSVYLANNKSLKNFTEYDLDEFSMVIHHSSDMEWNMKWFEIFFEEKLKTNVKGGQYLGIAINRYFHPNQRTRFPNPAKQELYLSYLKCKYPTMAKAFGFEDF